MVKRCRPVAFILILSSLIMTPAGVAADSAQAFRQQNGLKTYDPPSWFLEGYFIARETNPRYVFGPVQDFVRALVGTHTWLIEDLELNRLNQASGEGPKPEYSLFLETVAHERTQYWVFVVLPHESAQAWFEARRAFHGSKAEGYYGQTRVKLERALHQGFKINAELRFLIEKGDTSLQAPEDIILSTHNLKPVFDLGAGRRLSPADKTN